MAVGAGDEQARSAAEPGEEAQQEGADRLASVDPERRSFRYRHVRVPMPVTDSGGSFVVESVRNGRASVLLESCFVALDRAQEQQVAQKIEAAFQQALESLKRRVEQGLCWDAP